MQKILCLADTKEITFKKEAADNVLSLTSISNYTQYPHHLHINLHDFLNI